MLFYAKYLLAGLIAWSVILIANGILILSGNSNLKTIPLQILVLLGSIVAAAYMGNMVLGKLKLETATLLLLPMLIGGTVSILFWHAMRDLLANSLMVIFGVVIFNCLVLIIYASIKKKGVSTAAQISISILFAICLIVGYDIFQHKHCVPVGPGPIAINNAC